MKSLFLFLFFSVCVALAPVHSCQAENISASEEVSDSKNLDIGEVIFDHVTDSHSWHFFEGHYGTLFLPVVVYSSDKGLDFFSSSHFVDENHQPVSYNGYTLDHNKIYYNNKPVIDISITKNVLMLFITSLILFLVVLNVSKAYRRNVGKPPKGFQSAIELMVLFVKDEIVKPVLGVKHEKYLPYMLTLFFFIFFGNLLGLLPGAANLTGNIAVTMTLAVFTFIITNFSGNKNYWSHIFWTPGLPFLLRFIILPVEIIGIFTKPFALMIRLFAAITAGHIVILSLVCLTFIFKSWLVGFGSSLLVVLIMLIELLVAGIQAYVFTLFSSLYIGYAIENHEDGH